MGMILNITRFALQEDAQPNWDAVNPLIDAVQAEGLSLWADMFLDQPDIEDLINPYDDEDSDHEKVLPQIQEQLRKDVETLSSAVEKAPVPQLLVAPFKGYKIFMTGGMVDQVGAVCLVHAAAQRIDMLGGFEAAGFEALTR